MAFIAEHWQVIFGGVGAAAIAAIIGAFARSYFEVPTQCIQQQIMSGDGSTNIMAGRDAKVDRERP